MLADPRDSITRARVSTLLTQLAADPNSGIERILSHEEIASRSGFPDASFLVAFRPGYEFGDAYDGPVVAKPSNLGTHGYLPEHPEMRSSFFIVGPHIAAGHSLGEIDMRRIAPTLAGILHAHLKDAELEPLPLDSR